MISNNLEGSMRKMPEKKRGKKSKKIEGGPRKISQKKLTKAQWAWIEQILLELDDIKTRLDEVEKAIRLIKEKREIDGDGE